MPDYTDFWNCDLLLMDAVTARDALKIYRAALEQMPQALAQGRPAGYLHLEQGGPEEDLHPLQDSLGAWAVPAVLGDRQMLEVLDDYAQRYPMVETGPASKLWLGVVETVRSHLAANGRADIRQVRKLFDKQDRVRLRQVWRTLEDNDEVLVERVGSTIILHHVPEGSTPRAVAADRETEDGALEIRQVGAIKFRPVDSAATLQILPMAAVVVPVGETTEPAFLAEITPNPVPGSVQGPGWGNVLLVSGRQLHLGAEGKTITGRPYRPLRIKDLDGMTLVNANVPAGVVMQASTHQQAVVLYERDGQLLHALSADGNAIVSLNLRTSPEWNRMVKELKPARGEHIVKDAAVSISRRIVAVAVYNQVMVFSFDGLIVAVFKLPDEGSEQTYSGITVSSYRPDWVYGLDLAEDGDTLWIGGYSGVLHRMSLQTGDITSWKVPGPVKELEAVVGGCRWTSGLNLFTFDGTTCSRTRLGGGYAQILLGDLVIVSSKGHNMRLVNRRTVTEVRLTMPLPVQSAHLAGNDLILETRSRAYRVSLDVLA